MKRREPTADEVVLFELALKDTTRLAAKSAGPKLRAATKPKKPGTRKKTDQSAQLPNPALPPTKRRSKATPALLAASGPPESRDADEAKRGDPRKAAQERALFEAALKDAVPLDARALVTPHRRPVRNEAKAGLSAAGVGASVPAPGGLDGRRRTKLRRGDLEPEARLDLHGLTETAAHHALTAFVHQAMARRLRLVLIVTGKGLSQVDEHTSSSDLFSRRRGVLRQLTPRWLKEPELARFVAEMTPAHRRHGGEGALYVYLRKP